MKASGFSRTAQRGTARLATLMLAVGLLGAHSRAQAQCADLSGTLSWADTGVAGEGAGEVFSGDATLTPDGSGSYQWSWIRGWMGTLNATNSTFSLSGQTTNYSAQWTGTIAPPLTSPGPYTLTGTWIQTGANGDVANGTINAIGGGSCMGNHLVFLVQPPNGVVATPLKPAVTVQVQDSSNNPVTSNTDTIALSLTKNPGGAALTGASAAASGGTASFPSLSLNHPGQGYVLTATDSSNSAVTPSSSVAFNVSGCVDSAGNPQQLCLRKTGDASSFAYSISLQNGTAQTLAVTTTDTITPQFNVLPPESPFGTPADSTLSWPDAADTVDTTPGVVTWQSSLAAGAAPSMISYALTPANVTAANGDTIDIGSWPELNPGKSNTTGWLSTSKVTPTIARSGVDLVYSDQPEFLDGATQDVLGEPMGANVEGVLYQQVKDGSGNRLTTTGDFRLYLNHENRTNSPKNIYYMITNPDPHAAVSITVGSFGVGQIPGNPVASGKAALLHYYGPATAASFEISASEGCAGSAASATIAGNTTCAFLVGTLQGGKHDVITLIGDLTAGGAVQIGVVAVNAENAAAFAKNPATYHFEGGKSPYVRTYAAHNAQLHNGTEDGHVHGTFGYDEVDVILNYDVGAGKRYGWRMGDHLAGKFPGLSQSAFDLEYGASLDSTADHPVYLIGNYGVQYVVTVNLTDAKSGMATQILLNPRAAGDQGKYKNGFAGVVKTSGPPAGQIVVPATIDAIKSKTIAAGIGYVTGSGTYTLHFIPPAGDALPVAIVLAPAYVENTAVATANGVPSSQDTVILPLPDPNQ